MVSFLLASGAVVLLIWIGLWLAHGQFWRIETLPPAPSDARLAASLPSVVAIIPARNEAEVIEATLNSLWLQDYGGALRVVLVDDHSDDATAAIALEAARRAGREALLQVVASAPLPAGWAGKVWAMEQGYRHTLARGSLPHYILFSDADIRHGSDSVRRLVQQADSAGCDLASFMVRLRCKSVAERLMIPAFVFFFQMLYPFRRVNDPRQTVAAAAGGTMLVRREALERIEGLTRLRSALIDDCALACEIKRGGHRLWLGLSETSESIRGYGSLGEVVQMIARSAYTQLNYSPLRLAGCALGLFVTYLAPPLLAIGAARISPLASACGLAAWALMSLLYLPMVRFYRASPFWAPLLPLIASLYLWATFASALAHCRGRGGAWKGRAQSASLQQTSAPLDTR